MGGVGRMIGIWMGGQLYDGLGLQYAGWGFYQGSLFFLASGVMLISVLPLFFLPEGGAFDPQDVSPRTSDSNIAERSSDLKVYLLFLAAMALINFGRNSIAIIFPQYLSSSTGLFLDSRTLGYVLNTQSLAVVCFGWAVGWLCLRVGRERTLIAGAAIAVSALLILWRHTALPMSPILLRRLACGKKW